VGVGVAADLDPLDIDARRLRHPEDHAHGQVFVVAVICGWTSAKA
jgi:hypothetical protein